MPRPDWVDTCAVCPAAKSAIIHRLDLLHGATQVRGFVCLRWPEDDKLPDRDITSYVRERSIADDCPWEEV